MTRRHLSLILALWCFILAATLLVIQCGCGLVGPTALDPQTELERFAVSETARLSEIAGQRVVGEITEEHYRPGAVMCGESGAAAGCEAYAWYTGGVGRGASGVAYFQRDLVNQYGDQAVTWSAAHEVCHSVTGFGHDDRHAMCNQVLAGGQSPWR